MSKNIKVFIDCEFTDFVNCDLISIGLVSENGDSFYGENTEFVKAWSSTWVQENIYHMLSLDALGMTRKELSLKVWCWLEELECDTIEIMIDYAADWVLLHKLFNEDVHPKIKKVTNIFVQLGIDCDEVIKQQNKNDFDYFELKGAVRKVFDDTFVEYFLKTGEVQHHALSDAKANMNAYAAMQELLNFRKVNNV